MAMGDDSTIIGGQRVTPILERPPVEPGVSRGDAPSGPVKAEIKAKANDAVVAEIQAVKAGLGI